MTTKPHINILFVCLGNICRSPTAHGIFQDMVNRSGLDHAIRVDSCGTGDWHIGEPPDSRATLAAQTRGFDLSSLRARQITAADFHQFNYVMAMDEKNLADMQPLVPKGYAGDIDLFLRFTGNRDIHEVPDPYFGGEDGFEHVLDLVEEASQALLTIVRQKHQL